MADCKCKACVTACERNPGWFGLDDAEAALNAGYGDRMMLDWLTDYPDSVYVLAPASIGFAKSLAPEGDFAGMLAGRWCKGECVLLLNGLCTIHQTGFKPAQCRALTHKSSMDNYEAADPWNSDRGRALVARWKEEVEFES